MLFVRIAKEFAHYSHWMCNAWVCTYCGIHQYDNFLIIGDFTHFLLLLVITRAQINTQFEVGYKRCSHRFGILHVEPVKHLLNIPFLWQPRPLFFLSCMILMPNICCSWTKSFIANRLPKSFFDMLIILFSSPTICMPSTYNNKTIKFYWSHFFM